jgi:hypothetical protein
VKGYSGTVKGCLYVLREVDAPVIGVERLQRALRIIAASANVQNGSGPVSCNLIAPSDAGKTELILSSQPSNARVVNDFTFATLIKILDTPKPPTFLIVPDLNVIISHRPTVAALAMALLLSLMAEGVTDIPGIDEESKLKAKKLKQAGVKVALVTGMTPEMFQGKRGQWRKTGFLRRLVPIHYAYSAETEKAIQTSIEQGLDTLSYFHNSMPRVRQTAVDLPAAIRHELRELSEIVVTRQLTWGTHGRDGQKREQQAHAYPFSAHKTLRQLCRASALLHGRKTATNADLKDVKDLVKFMRYDRPEEI